MFFLPKVIKNITAAAIVFKIIHNRKKNWLPRINKTLKYANFSLHMTESENANHLGDKKERRQKTKATD